MDEKGKTINEKFKDHCSSIDEEFEKIESRSRTLSTAWKKFYESTRVIPDFYLNNRKVGFDWLEKKLEQLPETREKLSFVMNQIEIFNKLLIEAKLAEKGYERKHFQAFLDDVLIPLKNNLVEKIDFENKYGLTSVQQKETPPVQKVPDSQPEIIREKPNTEILTSLSKENEKSKKKKNTFKKIGLRWSDERIPELLIDLFLKHELIFENQKDQLRDFFKHAKVDPQIRFRKKGNVLITVFYELEEAKYLMVVKEYLAEQIEESFVNFNDTLNPLMTKGSIIAALAPGNVGRRIHSQSPDYVDVVGYLKEILKSAH